MKINKSWFVCHNVGCLCRKVDAVLFCLEIIFPLVVLIIANKTWHVASSSKTRNLSIVLKLLAKFLKHFDNVL